MKDKKKESKTRAEILYTKKKRIAEELKIDPNDLLTAGEADKYLGVSQYARWRYCRDNGISKTYGNEFYHKKDFANYFTTPQPINTR